MESKQKTPIALAIEELKAKRDLYSENGNLTIRSIRGAYVDAIVILQILKQKEREIISNAWENGYENGADAYIDKPIYHGSKYFEKTLTQE